MGKRLTQDEFVKKSLFIHNNKYNYSKVKYLNNKTEVIITCPIHGDFLQRPDSHLRGIGCPKCANKNITTEEFIEKARKVHGDKYDYSKVNYVDAFTNICIICSKHGEFWQRPNGHLTGNGCKYCNKSKGEENVEKFLKFKGIKYEGLYEINIPTFINKSGKTFIDFYLPEYNTFIEYNGKQHYVPIEHFGGKLKFNTYLIPRDEYIREYCKLNNINLIEIPYTVKTLDEINDYINKNIELLGSN